MSKLVSGRVKKTPQSGITSDRYQFLGLDQAEPDLGDPLIGPSSIGSNPYTGAIDSLYLISSDGSGNRYWISQQDAISGGIVNPGSITVRDTGVIVGSVNQITDINFVGTGVTVISPATWVGAGSSSVDVRIAISDVSASGNEGNIQFKSSAATGGLLKGSNQLIYVESTQRVGIGTTIPQHKLDVSGTIRSTGVISGVGTFTSIDVDQLIYDESTQRVGIGTTIPQHKLDVSGTIRSTGVISGVGTFTSIDVDQLIYDESTQRVGIGTTIPQHKLDVSGTIRSTGVISGVGTFTSIDVDQLIYDESTQRVGIGTTIPQHKLDVSGTIRSTGVISGFGTFTSININQGGLLGEITTGIGSFTASPGTAYVADSFNISTFDYKVVEYTLHITHSTGIQAQKVLIMQDGTNSYSQEYAIMFQPEILVSIGSTIVAGEARLLITPETGISGVTTYRFTRYSLE